MKKTLLSRKISIISLAILLFGTIQMSNAQINWIGATDGDFSNISNWDAAVVFTGGYIAEGLVIGPVLAPNINPVLSSDVASQPEYLDTFAGANITILASIVPWKNWHLNGIVTVDNVASNLNVRDQLHVGRGAIGILNVNDGWVGSKYTTWIGFDASGDGIVNVNGGTLEVGTWLVIANKNSPDNGELHVNSGKVIVAASGTGTLEIGEFGSVTIDNGTLEISGDKESEIAGHITNGKITTTGAKTIVVSYDAGTDLTTVTAEATASVRDINANAKYLFSVYPNPTKDVINITPKNNYSGKLDITITNVLGKIVIERELLQSHSGLYSINIKDQLTSGIYLVKIDAEDSSYFSKVIVE